MIFRLSLGSIRSAAASSDQSETHSLAASAQTTAHAVSLARRAGGTAEREREEIEEERAESDGSERREERLSGMADMPSRPPRRLAVAVRTGRKATPSAHAAHTSSASSSREAAILSEELEGEKWDRVLLLLSTSRVEYSREEEMSTTYY
eukprot:scaffold69899_cov35-Tisochrysis_lutea.AAC.1